MTRLLKEAQGIAAELARTKAALASAQETIAWQRAEIDRLIDQLKDTTRRPVPPMSDRTRSARRSGEGRG